MFSRAIKCLGSFVIRSIDSLATLDRQSCNTRSTVMQHSIDSRATLDR
jgi:hypothetical protein